jgi:hypothetical protein
MKALSLVAAFLLGFTAIAVAGESVEEITDLVKSAFDPSTGTFVDSAYETLIDADALIEEALLLDYEDPNEVKAFMGLNCLVKYNLACLASIDGNVDEAFDWLESSIDAGYCDVEWMAEDADLDPLRGDDRFVTLISVAEAMIAEYCDSGPCCGEHEDCCH